jgi:hypothetical protein
MATVAHTISVFAHNTCGAGNRRAYLVGSEHAQPSRELAIEPRAIFLSLAEDLIAEGAIAVAVPPPVIATQLQHIFESTFLHWAALDWDENTFREQLGAGFAFIFLGLFAGRDRDALLAEIASLGQRSGAS